MSPLKLVSNSEAGQLTQCTRCSDTCRVAEDRNPDARFLRHSLEPKGYCVNCAVTEFLWVMGCRELNPRPEDLRVPAVQEQFAKVVLSGHSDAKPDEINWEKVIAGWDLPFQVGRKLVSPAEHPLPPPVPRQRKRQERP